MVHQREILSLYYPIPGKGMTIHPGIVVSNDELFEEEGFFYCVMMSTKKNPQQYALEITPEMVTKDSQSISYAKCQIMATFTERDIEKRFGYLKNEYFEILIKKIHQSIF